ncbi:MAG: LPS export ABC transporter periplasmic protein LptC [Bryobacteraceae bacterium]|nr:LPS export ABC transporter periplasmic protein LptC [Bryobacteraceae bacterium]
MFRRARWLVLLALAVVTAFTAATFYIQRKAQRAARPKVSAPLPANISATADYWTWELKQGELPKVIVRARTFQQVKEPSSFLLQGVEMKVYDAAGLSYSLIKSARANFDTASGELYSDGEVDITTAIADGGTPSSPPMHIRSSGAHFDARSTKVWTERPATFEFEKGDGASVGASYDPQLHQLTMKSEVVLRWRGGGPVERQMVIEAGHLVYHELTSEIFLTPHAKLTRGTFTLTAGDSVVILNGGALDRVEAVKASGEDRTPKRTLTYAAQRLNIYFGADAAIRRIEGLEGTRLISQSPAGSTVVTAERVDMDFVSTKDGSELSKSVGTGKARLESTPAKRPNGVLPPVRTLASEVIEVRMRPGGEEISEVATHSATEAEFIPRRPEDRRRKLNGERLTVKYGPGNMAESLVAVDVTTRTENPKKGGKPSVAVTRSKMLQAQFDTATGQTTRIEQWPDFEYEEGTLKARAAKAVLDSPKEEITLDGSARLWDETGSTTADVIVLDQNTGDLTATGHVASTRMPDVRSKSSDGMLDARQSLQARAEKMRVTEKNQRIVYEGEVLMWQAGSRLRGKRIEIDRAADRLTATGDVMTLIPDDRGGGRTRPGATTVRAPSMVYDDKVKLAYYSGGTTMERPNMDLNSAQLRVWFREEKDSKGAVDTRLDRIFADGAVLVVEKGPKASKTGSSEHGEYYPGEERMVLTGGNPLVTDKRRGTTRSSIITWLLREDRLMMDNTGSGPAVSRIIKDERK